METKAVKENPNNMFEKTTHSWIINAKDMVGNKISQLLSPIFIIGKDQHSFQVSLRHRIFIGKISITLIHESSNEFLAEHTLTLKHMNGEMLLRSHLMCSSAPKDKRFTDSEWHVDPEELSYLIRNLDHIVIEVNMFTQISTSPPQNKVNISIEKTLSHKLLCDFEALFESGEWSDFDMKFDNDEIISVHRSILAARSPVFSAMFKHDVSESKLGYAKITDVDKDTMVSLLRFIYTGDARNLSREEAKRLLPVSDKYEVMDLKQLCEDVLTGNLQMSDISDILIMAELHQCSKLKQVVFDYIIGNPSNFKDMSTFDNIKRYPDLLIELISKMSLKLH